MRKDAPLESSINAGIVVLNLRIDQMKHEIRVAMTRHTDELKALADQAMTDALKALPHKAAEMAAGVILDSLHDSLEAAMRRIMESPAMEIELDALAAERLKEALSTELGEER